jgi:hypothetical protein
MGSGGRLGFEMDSWWFLASTKFFSIQSRVFKILISVASSHFFHSYQHRSLKYMLKIQSAFEQFFFAVM